MKIAILSEDKPGFIKPMSIGLKKMLSELNVESDVYFDGLALLNFSPYNYVRLKIKNILKQLLNSIDSNRYLPHKVASLSEYEKFKNAMGSYDAIIVVCNIPDSFKKNKLINLELLREQTQVPIVLYQNYYLATRGEWYSKIMSKPKKEVGFGLERYDWYLAASVISDFPLSKHNHPYNVIGHNIKDEILKPKLQKKFKVLLDFNRKGFEEYRAIQLQALKETNIEYTQLSGRYSQEKIKKIYSEHSALFLSTNESFGLPIIENQLCGNYIFLPFKSWTPSHYINKPIHDSGEGDLGRNFIIYNHKLSELKTLLIQCKDNYNSSENYAHFQSQYPQFIAGDLVELNQFVADLSSDKINSENHKNYATLNNSIVEKI
jgi:hypothetical protein